MLAIAGQTAGPNLTKNGFYFILKLSYNDFQPVSNFFKEITFILISHFIKFIIHKIYSSSRSKNIT